MDGSSPRRSSSSIPSTSASASKPGKRKAAAPAKPVIPLIKPAAKSSKKTEKIPLSGYEAAASRFRELDAKIDSLSAEQKAVRAEIVDAARSARRDAECAGQFARSVEIATDDDDKPVTVTFGDSYSTVALENEAALRGALGANFDVVFTRTVTVKMRSRTTLGTLREALGDRYEAFAALVAVEEALAVQPSTMETRARLRPTLTADQNTVLDGVLDQVQYSPKVSAK